MPKENKNNRLNLIAKYFSKQKEELRYYSLCTLFWYVDIDKNDNVDIKLLNCEVDDNSKVFFYYLFTREYSAGNKDINGEFYFDNLTNIHFYDCVTGEEVDIQGNINKLYKFSKISYPSPFTMSSNNTVYLFPTHNINSQRGNLMLRTKGMTRHRHLDQKSNFIFKDALDKYGIADIESFRPFRSFSPNVYVSSKINVIINGLVSLKCDLPYDEKDSYKLIERSVCLDNIMAQNIVIETKKDLEHQIQMLKRRDEILNFSK